MRITIVTSQATEGQDHADVKEAHAFAGNLRSDDAVDRAVAHIATKILKEQEAEGDITFSALTAIRHVRQTTIFTVLWTELCDE